VAVWGGDGTPPPPRLHQELCKQVLIGEFGSFYFWNSAQNHHAPRIYMAPLSFIYNPLSLFPLSLGPSELGSTAAQFCNEDRIKISSETVEPLAITTNNITSKTVLHRITRSIVRNRTLLAVRLAVRCHRSVRVITCLVTFALRLSCSLHYYLPRPHLSVNPHQRRSPLRLSMAMSHSPARRLRDSPGRRTASS
jgi:hypothetical protein